MYAHFAKIAEAVDIPQVLYNIPARTGRNVEPETIERLARIAPIVAVKEAAGSLDQVSDIAARTDLTILSGDDSLTLPMLAVGGSGVVSVVGNLVPRDVRAMMWSPRSRMCGCGKRCRTRYSIVPMRLNWST